MRTFDHFNPGFGAVCPVFDILPVLYGGEDVNDDLSALVSE